MADMEPRDGKSLPDPGRAGPPPDPASPAVPELRLPAGGIDGDSRRVRPGLARILGDVESVLVYSHMNPDPDTVGSALALRQLLSEAYGKRVSICYRGIVGRAENRRMLSLVGNGVVRATQLDCSAFDGAFIVDCQPDGGIVPDVDPLPLLGVIDHHPMGPHSACIPYTDIRPDYGSTSTILTEYLREEGMEPRLDVATALFYGLKTDTADLSRRTGPADIRAYEWLLPRIDRQLLSDIENPPLSRDYFSQIVGAVGRAVTYQSTVMTELGRMPYPDMVAEVADRLIQLEGMVWSVCFGMHDQRIYLSVRTVHPTRDAGEMVRAVLRDEGIGGGHDTMAAGRVQLLEDSEETYVRVVTELWNRFLASLGEDPAQGRRLVADSSFPERIHPAL